MDQKIVWSFIFLLTGVESQRIDYPLLSTCAVRGSTVTLACTFTPLTLSTEIPLRIVRVLWCVNHEICQGTTPSVYDSNSTHNDPRYQYLGDKKGSCTLQIRDLQTKDGATFRFRMEADDIGGHFTNRTGVKVTVVDEPQLTVRSSSEKTQLRRGQAVSLLCTSSDSVNCSFHQLDITWLKDGHALSETGPALLLGPLTAEDSGNYSCALKMKNRTQSESFRLQVEDDDSDVSLTLGAVFGVLLVAVALVLLIIVVMKRKRAAAVNQEAETELKPVEVDSSVRPPAERHAGSQRKETGREAEDVSYASVQFKVNKKSRNVEEADDAIIYSSVASRG